MADNVEVPVETGVQIATDEINGLQYQRIKLAIGADGEAQDLDSGQAAKANSIPVVIASDQDPLDVAGPLTDDELRAADVKVSLDGESVGVTGPLTDTELRATPVPVSGPATNTELRAADLKVSLDGEAVGLAAGTNNIGDVDVLSLPSLPAGTNNIGDVDVLSLPSLPAGTNNVGDVDVLTLPELPAGTNFIGRVATPVTTADADFTQIITVTTAGTPVQGPNKSNANGWCLHASPQQASTDWVCFMYHGETAANKGFKMGVAQIIYTGIQNLSDLDFDASLGGSIIYAYKC